MQKAKIEIVKSRGEKVRFSFDELKAFPRKSGAREHLVEALVEKIKEDLFAANNLFLKQRNYYDHPSF